jgi:hypothetical protein
MKLCRNCQLALDFLRTKGHRVRPGGGIGVWEFGDIEVSDLGLMVLALAYGVEWLQYLAGRSRNIAA